jgi:hypothetical protein
LHHGHYGILPSDLHPAFLSLQHFCLKAQQEDLSMFDWAKQEMQASIFIDIAFLLLKGALNGGKRI